MAWSFKFFINCLANFKLNVLPDFCLLKPQNAKTIYK